MVGIRWGSLRFPPEILTCDTKDITPLLWTSNQSVSNLWKLVYKIGVGDNNRFVRADKLFSTRRRMVSGLIPRPPVFASLRMGRELRNIANTILPHVFHGGGGGGLPIAKPVFGSTVGSRVLCRRKCGALELVSTHRSVP